MKGDVSFQDAKFICGSITVPEKMIGCWERLSIRFSDGTEDKTTRAIWLQTLSGVGDIRIPASRPDLRERKGFGDCSKDELLKLAEQDCFCGVTFFDPDANPFPTASWPKEAYLFRFQPVITFPEPGWIEWRNSGTCMIEKSPSGAYEEDWRLQPEVPIVRRASDQARRGIHDMPLYCGRARGLRAKSHSGPTFA